MFEWIPIGASMMTAAGFDREAETIYVCFTNDKEWWYSACPRFGMNSLLLASRKANTFIAF